MMRAYREGIAGYFDVEGRASRADFWLYVLQAGVIALLVQLIDRALGYGSLLIALVTLFHPAPGTTFQVRRLHDVNRSGWWVLIAFTIIGVIPLLIWLCRRGDDTPNRFDHQYLKMSPGVGSASVAASQLRPAPVNPPSPLPLSL